jgi:uridine kinase
LVWVTGNSGTGKSTVCGVLRARGHVALDADEDGFSRWTDRATGEVVVDPPCPVPGGWLDRHGWAIVRERVETLVEESRLRIAFLCGSAENEAEVRDLFDLVVCLVIDEDTLRHRLATRTTNAFGQHPEELAAALKWNPRMRAIYENRGATVIDASKPVTEVVDSVIDAVRDRSPHPVRPTRSS